MLVMSYMTATGKHVLALVSRTQLYTSSPRLPCAHWALSGQWAPNNHVYHS